MNDKVEKWIERFLLVFWVAICCIQVKHVDTVTKKNWVGLHQFTSSKISSM